MPLGTLKYSSELWLFCFWVNLILDLNKCYYEKDEMIFERKLILTKCFKDNCIPWSIQLLTYTTSKYY